MKRSLVVFGLTMVVAGALHAAVPFGGFGGVEGGDNAGAGVIQFHGWALDDDGVAAVDIFVDGVIAGRAEYGRPRVDVSALHPGFPDSAAAGFAFGLNSTQYLNGLHEVSARVLSATGERRFLQPTYQVLFTNTDHTLAPFGKITFPNDNAEMFGNCDINDLDRRYSVVYGWALDAGVSEGDMGIGWVELLIDGSTFANDQVSCYYADITGGYSNCYGLRSLDIEKKFPTLRNAPHANYRFVLDVGALIAFGYSRGHHILTVRSGDIFTQVRNIDEIPVTFACDEDVANEGAFGRIGSPKNGNRYAGLVDVVGWVLDREGTNRVIIFVDGREVGDARVFIDRPEVRLFYPGYPNSFAPGYEFILDTTELSDGPHHLQVIHADTTGSRTLIGERTFYVANLE